MSQKFFAYHIGVHGVVGRKFNRFFHNHRAKLSAAGIHAPLAKAYRPYIRNFVWGRDASLSKQASALQAFGCPLQYSGLTLSNDQALSGQRTLFENGEFLFWAEARVAKLASLFADHRIIFLLEVENFATFLPRFFDELLPEEVERISQWPLDQFSWSDLIEGIQSACPEAEIIVAPTEVIATKSHELIAKMTTRAVLPKPTMPAPVSKEALEAFQLAIEQRMSEPLDPELAAKLYETMGWDEKSRILLSRQYYSEILEMYHTCTLVI